MLTAMTEDDWALCLHGLRERTRPRKPVATIHWDDRKFLEALHYFTVHNITWRALSAEFGHWNSIWKRFWQLSRAGIFEAFFDALAALSESAHLVQMFELHGSARPRLGRGGKGGARRSGARPFAWRLLNQNPPQGRPRRLAARLPSDRAKPATAATSNSCSTSDPIFCRAPPSPTKVTTPNPIATAPASAAFVRSFRIARLQPTDQLSSRKSSTKRGRASSRPSANSSASSASPFVARRLRAITVPSSRSPSASS